ncbi:SUF system Fe-S cluster assembly protein [Kiloniella laminariae]|uniref:SUF system Fe-S cluster assembly protein n=1 Tax=Kiloniella laminariae TaxID=454162 RepID=UPI0003776A20|nr:SUF system Fe-S cluster assembly protein [Kiloniella laminariae]
MFNDGKTLSDFLPNAEEGFMAKAGIPLPAGSAIASKTQVIDALQSVHDPEIPVNIYDLGLIYKHDIAENGDVDISMTLTAPACPVAGELPGQVAEAVAAVEGIGEVTVVLTWSPPWNQNMMSEDAQLALGLFM